MIALTVVHCPICHESVTWSPQNPYRPFCCQRCQLIDLGEWASEKKVIAGPTIPYSPEFLTDFD
ncbi:DNA gyrase inhibitor YacG [unidentified bacterial endosymbiont]|uniref:DNA gyrase inhibitor YacG n=1 Tax=unidentified bacterial endosymbiont TaxID=2355 RepID=UPI003F519F7C